MIDVLTKQLEHETGNKIFTIGVLENSGEDNAIELVVVFENKEILMAFLTVELTGDDIKMRMRGNYLN